MGFTRYFRAYDGEIFRIDNIVEDGITIASPLIAHGYYRDEPPTVPSGASQMIVDTGVANTTGLVTQFIGGATTPAVAVANVSGSVYEARVTADSSLLENDQYAHEELRFIWGPVSMIFFQTEDALATNPDTDTFDIERPLLRTPPKDTFDAFNIDCAFYWDPQKCGVFNHPPPGSGYESDS